MGEREKKERKGEEGKEDGRSEEEGRKRRRRRKKEQNVDIDHVEISMKSHVEVREYFALFSTCKKNF